MKKTREEILGSGEMLCTYCKYEGVECGEYPCSDCEEHIGNHIRWIPKTQEHDPVNHPAHYETGKFDCIDVMQEVFGVEAVKDFCLCNAFKYLYRTNRKNGLEDVEKCKWYIDKYIELTKGK